MPINLALLSNPAMDVLRAIGKDEEGAKARGITRLIILENDVK